VAELADFLAMTRNDLEPAATRLAPAIAQVRADATSACTHIASCFLNLCYRLLFLEGVMYRII
jgi:hypothetical protein